MGRTQAAAAVVHGRFNAGAQDKVLLDGRWRRIQHVNVIPTPEDQLTEEDRQVRGMLAGHDLMVQVTVGRGPQREQHRLWPGDVLIINPDRRFP